MTPAPMPAPMPYPLRDDKKPRAVWPEGLVPDPAYLAHLAHLAHLVRPCACDACRKGPTQ